jgi:hypothetical protein
MARPASARIKIELRLGSLCLVKLCLGKLCLGRFRRDKLDVGDSGPGIFWFDNLSCYSEQLLRHPASVTQAFRDEDSKFAKRCDSIGCQQLSCTFGLTTRFSKSCGISAI